MPAVLAQRSRWLLERRTAIAAEGYTQGIAEWWFPKKRPAVKPGNHKALTICHLGADSRDLRLARSPQSVSHARE
jgi:hypothetical protein